MGLAEGTRVELAGHLVVVLIIVSVTGTFIVEFVDGLGVAETLTR